MQEGRISELTPDRPYPGLREFRERESTYFKGRKVETQELLDLVEDHTLTVLFGKSGLGKTSLLQAGLMPALREIRYLPVYIRLKFDAGAPDLRTQVRSELRAAFHAAGIQAPPPPGLATPLWTYFHTSEFWDPELSRVMPVLIFDQFEELFTLGKRRNKDDRDAFIQELSEVAENFLPKAVRERLSGDKGKGGAWLPESYDEPCAKVVLALREDYLAELEELRPHFPSIGRARKRLHAMDGTRAMQAVLQVDYTATDGAPNPPDGKILDADTAEAIVRKAARAPDKPLSEIRVESALLALYCSELEKKRRPGPDNPLGRIEIGLVRNESDNILRDFYDRSVEQRPHVRDLIEKALVTPDGHRDRCAVGRATHEYGVSTADIDYLVSECRLVREVQLGGDGGGEKYLEIVHDVLLDPIQDAAESREQQTRRKRWLIWGAATAVALCVLGSGAVWLTNQRDLDRARQTEQAKAHGEMARAQTDLAAALLVKDDLDEGVRALVAANRSFSAAKAAAAHAGQPSLAPRLPALGPLLRRAHERTRGLSSTRLLPQGLQLVRPSPNGLILALIYEDGRSGELLDDKQRPLCKLDNPGPPPPEAGGPAEGPTPAQSMVLGTKHFRGPITDLLFSGDGSLLFAEDRKEHIVVWRVSDCQRVAGFRVRSSSSALDFQSRFDSFDRDRDPRRLLLDTSQDGSRFLISGGGSRRALVVPLDQEPPIELSPPPPDPGKDSGSPAPAVSAPIRRDGTGLSADGSCAVITREQGGALSVATHDTATGREQSRQPLEKGTSKVVLGLHRKVAVALSSGGVTAWKLEGCKLTDPRALRVGPTSHVRVHDDRDLLVAARDRLVRAWRLGDPDAAPLFQHTFADSIDDLKLGTKGHVVVSAGGALTPLDPAAAPADRLGRAMVTSAWSTSRLRTGGPRIEVSPDTGTVFLWSPSDGVLRTRRLAGDPPHGGGDGPLSTGAPGSYEEARSISHPIDTERAAAGTVVLVDDEGIDVLSASQTEEPSPQPLRWAVLDPGQSDLSGRVSLSADGKWLVAVDAPRRRMLHGEASKKPAPPLTLDKQDPDNPFPILSADGQWLVLLGDDDRIALWDLGQKKRAWFTRIERLKSGGVSAPPRSDDWQVGVALADGGTPRVVVGGPDGLLRVLHKPGKELLVETVTTSRAVTAVATGAGGLIAFGMNDGTVRIRSLDGKERSPFQLPQPARTLRFSDDGASLFAGTAGGLVSRREVASSRETCALSAHRIAIDSIEPLARSHEVISVDLGGNAVLWDERRCESRHRWDRVSAATGAAGGPFVTATWFENTVSWWRAARPDDRAAGHRAAVVAGGFLGAGTLVTADMDGKIKRWRVADRTGSDDPPIGAAPGGFVRQDAADGERAAVWSATGRVVRWRNAAPLDDLSLPVEEWTVEAAALAPEPAALLTLERSGRALRLRRTGWEAPGNGEVKPLDRHCDKDPAPPAPGDKQPPPGPEDVREIAFAAAAPPKAVHLAASDSSHCVTVWTGDGQRLFSKRQEGAAASHLTFSPSGALLFSGGDTEKACLWQLGPPMTCHPLGLDSSGVTAARFAPAIEGQPERLLIGTQAGSLWMWQAAPGPLPVPPALSGSARLLGRRHDAPVRVIAFHPRAPLAATADDLGSVWLWDTEKGRALARLGRVLAPALWLTFRPDGEELFAAGADGWVLVWDTGSDPPAEVGEQLERWLPDPERKTF